MDDEIYCQRCGADLTPSSTKIVTTTQHNLPAAWQNPQLPRSVAASVGAVALGVGIELLRRGLVARLSQPTTIEQTLPALGNLKDILVPRNKSGKRLKRGYEVEETVVYVRRVTRR
ncbi:MAG TPA: hypothetical protein VHZ51_03925 [Ktedonobacteraceae bacterium]|jgi:hypothetical protein|nr:hypothetical protein [Ktedonobacteraceae bacterium]